MIIQTASGNVTINKKSPYGKWLLGWIKGNGFTGTWTLQQAWTHANDIKTADCSWYSLGWIMAVEKTYWKHYKDE